MQRLFSVTPAVLSVAASVFAAESVRLQQTDYPRAFMVFQMAMVAITLLFIDRHRSVWVGAFLALVFAVLFAGAPVGLYYVPGVAVTGTLVMRRLIAKP